MTTLSRLMLRFIIRFSQVTRAPWSFIFKLLTWLIRKTREKCYTCIDSRNSDLLFFYELRVRWLKKLRELDEVEITSLVLYLQQNVVR